MNDSYTLIETTDDARRTLVAWADVPLVGLDTETYFDPQARRMRLSLVQLARADEHAAPPVIIIDALQVEPEHWRGVIEAETTRMAAHNARFDQKVLIDAGLAPRAFVDTLSLARRVLRLGSYTLTAVAEELFGISPDKSLQKSDWRRRPLAPAQLTYAAQDARLTLAVYQELSRRLGGASASDVALRAAQLDDEPGTNGGTRRRRNTSFRLPPLTREEKVIYEQLKRWRTEHARANRTPAYMICPDKTLEHIAHVRPVKIEELNSIYGLGEAKVKRFGAELLDALEKADHLSDIDGFGG